MRRFADMSVAYIKNEPHCDCDWLHAPLAPPRLASCCFCWWFQFLLVLLHVLPVIWCCCCCRCVAADNWWMSVFGARFDWRFRSFVAPIASHSATWINYVAQTAKSCLHFVSSFVLFWAPLAAALKLHQPCPELCCSNTNTHTQSSRALTSMAATETRTTIGKKYLNQMGGETTMQQQTATTFATTIAATLCHKSYVHFQQLCDPPNTATNWRTASAALGAESGLPALPEHKFACQQSKAATWRPAQ